eukprot:jgi/Psemu1/33772/gm1.33772_g
MAIRPCFTKYWHEIEKKDNPSKLSGIDRTKGNSNDAGTGDGGQVTQRTTSEGITKNKCGSTDKGNTIENEKEGDQVCLWCPYFQVSPLNKTNPSTIRRVSDLVQCYSKERGSCGEVLGSNESMTFSSDDSTSLDSETTKQVSEEYIPMTSSSDGGDDNGSISSFTPSSSEEDDEDRKVLKPRFLLDSAEYCARSNELNNGDKNDKRNPFLYHFETGFNVLCAKNGNLVITILNGCNKIDNVRERLNSPKGHFDEEEALEIWEQCFKYVTEEIFPFYEEGDTGGVDHVWAMGIIMAYVLCGYPALKGTEDIQCYNNVGIGRPLQSRDQERLKLNARKHIKKCIHFNGGNRPCLTSLWFNEWRTMTEEAIIEKYRIMYIEETDDGKKRNKETEKNKIIKDNWNLFMKKVTKQSKRKKQKLKQLANKEKREEEDGNERNIVHWLQLYEKGWNSPEDLEEYNNYPVPCGAWGRVKH